jgi:hypothetical protein
MRKPWSMHMLNHVGFEVHSNIYDTDHYLVVAKVRERLAVNKQKSYGFHMERFNLKKLNAVEIKSISEHYGQKLHTFILSYVR